MSIKDMPPGELLFKLVNPYAPTVQIQKQGREISRLKKYSKSGGNTGGGTRGITDPNHEGGGGPETTDEVPVVDLDAGWITTTGVWSADGVYQPRLALTMPAAYSMVRGFAYFRMSVTRNADTAYASTHIVTGTQFPYPGFSTIAFALPPKAGGEKVQVQVQIVSSYYGAGGWSASVDYTVAADAAAPTTITGLASTTMPGGSRLDWNVPTDADYSHTQVYLGSSGSATKYMGATKGGHYEIVWDFATFSILSYTHVWVRPVDLSGNVGAWTSVAASSSTIPTESISTGAITAGKIAVGGISASNQFAAGVVDSAALGSGAVTAGKIGTSGISASGQFAAGVVDSAALGSGAVTNTKLGTITDTSKFQLDATTGPLRFYDDIGDERGNIVVDRSLSFFRMQAILTGASDYNSLWLETFHGKIRINDSSTAASRTIQYITGDATAPHLFSTGSVVTHQAALSTTATDGFLYVTTCAGAPTGTPTTQTGTAALVYDTTNNNLYVYNGAWKKVNLA